MEKLEAEIKLLKRNEFAEMGVDIDKPGIIKGKQFLAMPASEELRAVTQRSIADLFVNFGLATSRFFTVISEKVWKLTSAGVKDHENERKIIGKNEVVKGMKDTFDLGKDLANIR